MNHRMPGLPVHPQLQEFTQSHVHWVGDAIQPSHPLLSPSPPALNLSQYQSQMIQLFLWGGQSIGVSALSVLPVNTQDWSPLGWTRWIFLQSKGLSRVFSKTTVQKHQFFGCSAFIMWTQPLLWSHPYMTTGKTIAWTKPTFVDSVMSLLIKTDMLSVCKSTLCSFMLMYRFQYFDSWTNFMIISKLKKNVAFMSVSTKFTGGRLRHQEFLSQLN